MKNGKAFVLVAALVATGCATHGKAAVPATAEALPIAPAMGAAAALTPELQRLSTAFEPLNCKIEVAEDRPDLDVAGVKCLLSTVQQTQYFVSQGGKPTQFINPAAFDHDRETARMLLKRLDKYFAEAKYGATETSPDARVQSEQAYLNGVLYFQKGDYALARKEWTRALKLDPSSDDAKAGLSMLDKLEK
jgi:tetratricopeptide (TPR) repeat protein